MSWKEKDDFIWEIGAQLSLPNTWETIDNGVEQKMDHARNAWNLRTYLVENNFEQFLHWANEMWESSKRWYPDRTIHTFTIMRTFANHYESEDFMRPLILWAAKKIVAQNIHPILQFIWHKVRIVTVLDPSSAKLAWEARCIADYITMLKEKCSYYKIKHQFYIEDVERWAENDFERELKRYQESFISIEDPSKIQLPAVPVNFRLRLYNKISKDVLEMLLQSKAICATFLQEATAQFLHGKYPRLDPTKIEELKKYKCFRKTYNKFKIYKIFESEVTKNWYNLIKYIPKRPLPKYTVRGRTRRLTGGVMLKGKRVTPK